MQIEDMQMNEVIYNETFILIEDMCLMLTNRGLIHIGMTTPNRQYHEYHELGRHET